MNRRNFLKNILVAGASFNILPGAGRIWRAVRSDLWYSNPISDIGIVGVVSDFQVEVQARFELLPPSMITQMAREFAHKAKFYDFIMKMDVK